MRPPHLHQPRTLTARVSTPAFRRWGGKLLAAWLHRHVPSARQKGGCASRPPRLMKGHLQSTSLEGGLLGGDLHGAHRCLHQDHKHRGGHAEFSQSRLGPSQKSVSLGSHFLYRVPGRSSPVSLNRRQVSDIMLMRRMPHSPHHHLDRTSRFPSPTHPTLMIVLRSALTVDRKNSSRPVHVDRGVCLTAAPSNEGPSPINFPGGGSPGGGSTWGPPVPTPRPQAPWGACRVFAESPGSEPEICEPWLTLSVPCPGSLKSSVAQPSAGERHHADEEDASFTSSPSRSHIEISI